MIAGNLAHLQQYGEFCALSLWDCCSRSLDISIELMNLMIVLTPRCLSITKLNFIYTCLLCVYRSLVFLLILSQKATCIFVFFISGQEKPVAENKNCNVTKILFTVGKKFRGIVFICINIFVTLRMLNVWLSGVGMNFLHGWSTKHTFYSKIVTLPRLFCFTMNYYPTFHTHAFVS